MSPPGLDSFHIIPIAFGAFAGGQAGTGKDQFRKPGLTARLRGRLRWVRYYLGPLSLIFYRAHYRTLLDDIQPDLVHALRIPFEGMLATATTSGIPLVLSIWGNDLTLHARGSIWMARLTRKALIRAEGLVSDTQRDIRLGHTWGFKPGKPTMVVPGSGGIRLDEQSKSSESEPLPEELPDGPIIVNSRGQRPGSLRQDAFFRAIPMVLGKISQAVFVCPSLQGDRESEGWVDRLGIRSRTLLWPRLTQAQLWTLFRKSQIFVSPSIHDGTPNSLLEAMVCGCFPVVGDTESMKEWVETGINGLLVDATNASVDSRGSSSGNQPARPANGGCKNQCNTNCRTGCLRTQHGAYGRVLYKCKNDGRCSFLTSLFMMFLERAKPPAVPAIRSAWCWMPGECLLQMISHDH